MLAILGLIGVAISALVVMDTENTDDDAAAESGDTLDSGGSVVSNMDLGDIVYADEAGAEIFGSAWDDILAGTDGNDTVYGGDGDDDLTGGRGDDTIYGGTGDDDLKGSVGDDEIYGDDGHDKLIGGDGDDWLDGGAGDDALQGYLGDDTLTGGAGTDTLFGGADDDVLDGRGDGAKDYLNGGHGDDQIYGDTDDLLHGGEGEDTFSVVQDANALVSDFNAGEDMIEVLYEGSVPPVLTTAQTDDGLALMADGEIVTTLAAIDSLDLSRVTLVAA